MSARDDFLSLRETFLWLDEDDSNNTMGAFLGLVWLVLRFLKMGFLMSYDKTKTLELGVLDWEENNKVGFIWRIAWKQLICDKILMDVFWIG
jgi:hypothetical protein